MTHDYHDDARYVSQVHPRIEALTIECLPRLRLGWSSRFDHDDVGRLLQAHPGLSLWSSMSGEYVIGGPWRHRDEIASVLELSAGASAIELLDEFADAARAAGKRLVIASEHAESRRHAFYEAAGYELVEQILVYELSRLRPIVPAGSGLHFERVTMTNPAVVDELIELDHRSFPWLWWNSREEFENYASSLGVEIYLGRDESGTAMSYIGVTRFRNWGHLDRIAVLPEYQGRGYGLEALDWAVYILSQSGARRIGLSTQERNERSRRLYERYGFHRVSSQDYALFGRWLGPAESV